MEAVFLSKHGHFVTRRRSQNQNERAWEQVTTFPCLLVSFDTERGIGDLFSGWTAPP